MIINLAKKMIAEEIAEWIHLVREDLSRLEKSSRNDEVHDDGSVSGFSTEIGGRDDLLEDTVIAEARTRKIGFTL